MKRLLTGLAAASLLAGVPRAAAAHGDRDDHRRGWERHGHHGDWHKPRHARYHHYYRSAPPPVVYYAAPHVVYRPVYVPAPVPVVRYPYPPVDGPRVSVGFRVFF